MNDLYCSMIHGGLYINFRNKLTGIRAGHCCLRSAESTTFPVNTDHNFWKNKEFEKLRETNKQNIWDPGCSNCQILESSNNASFRNGMNEGLQIFGQTNMIGPSRIDLMFDISCNLACRSCGPNSSTYWMQHLKENKLWNIKESKFSDNNVTRNRSQVIDALSKLDLSNLKQLVFCGGETLLGQEYWHVASWLADNVPNAKQQLTLCFQTNGTQPIHSRNFTIIEKFHLVKLHVSLDGVGNRFEYLRWPAQWNQVTDNILNLRETLPGNVMFVVEETVSIFNLLYQQELNTWVDNNFTQNKEGDVINHTRHMAKGVFNLQNMSAEYVEFLKKTDHQNLIPPNWQENSLEIQNMLAEIKKFDVLRNESFENVFPELANLYSRYW